MRGRPDLVLKNKKQNSFLIVERKTTRLPRDRVPDVGWLNVEAQLWSYSKMDAFASADEVIQVGQTWEHVRNGFQLTKHFVWRGTDHQH
jgi:hypothetical protein